MIWLLFPAFLIVMSSCQKDEVTPDPEGTVSTALTNVSDLVLFKGIAADGGWSASGVTYPYLIIRMGMSYSALVTDFENQYSTKADFSDGWGTQGNEGSAEAVDMGKVDGLGDVKTKPTVGYTNRCSLQVGHGYVVRFKQSKDLNSTTLPYVYYRFYFESFLKSATTGGVNGGKIKMQGPF